MLIHHMLNQLYQILKNIIKILLLYLDNYINVFELTLQYDLPTESIQNLVEKELGYTVHGKQDKQDSRMFYTENFIAKNRAKIRGALSAIT
ncbi:hypothetical protein HCN44_008739 [Aphidius gifuensis]|uniref:E3 UFM1-protein ligase 1 homolog n=1 Tax=Aphidius gifuensis TaxID=684658 RepID=A0A835CTH1_APHGI|nr:hypothetical protein HCN44_008739 [Aphidius gifuensis]